MLALLLRFWPYIAGGVAIVGLMLLISHWRSEAAKVPDLEKQIATLQTQLETERAQTKEDKQTTETIEVTYETRLANLNKLLDGLRQRPARCIMPAITTKTSGTTTTTAGKELPGGDAGITDTRLYEIAGRCEKERLKLLGLQDYTNQLYKRL